MSTLSNKDDSVFVASQQHLRPGHSPIVDERRQPAGLVTPLQDRGPQMDVVHVQNLPLDQEIRALAIARLARAPGQIVLTVMHDWIAAQHDIAELMVPKRAHAVHDPAHAQRRANLFRLPGADRARANDLLQGNDVRVDVA